MVPHLRMLSNLLGRRCGCPGPDAWSLPTQLRAPARIAGVSEQPPTERPGRYQRSTSGLVGAMIVTVVAVLAFIGYRALNRDDLQITPERVDYLATVSTLQADGKRPIYPVALPDSWIATSVDVKPARTLDWGVGLLTADDEFVGIRQSAGSLDDLVETYVDEDADEGDQVTLSGALTDTWRTFTDAGGDRAYAAVVGDDQVLVFGSAPDAQLRAVVESLTQEPVVD